MSSWAYVSGPENVFGIRRCRRSREPDRELDRTAMADGRSDSAKPSPEEEEAKARVLIDQGKEETKTIVGKEKSPTHEKETHGTSDDIDQETPIELVKGPGVLERAKEEIEAVVEAIHPKK
ncbi:hypothetical protein LXL04_032204 [Taraxacum kok-saghyz]